MIGTNTSNATDMAGETENAPAAEAAANETSMHAKLNARARKAQLPFYQLVPPLQAEAGEVTLQVRLVTDWKLTRRVTLKYETMQSQLIDTGPPTIPTK